jgi:antitoxin component of MazEF toxin-antitoxin module
MTIRELATGSGRANFTLERLVAQINPKNRHREIGWGRPVGKEKW